MAVCAGRCIHISDKRAPSSSVAACINKLSNLEAQNMFVQKTVMRYVSPMIGSKSDCKGKWPRDTLKRKKNSDEAKFSL